MERSASPAPDGPLPGPRSLRHHELDRLTLAKRVPLARDLLEDHARRRGGGPAAPGQADPCARVLEDGRGGAQIETFQGRHDEHTLGRTAGYQNVDGVALLPARARRGTLRKHAVRR